jgi:hypothetical protein
MREKRPSPEPAQTLSPLSWRLIGFFVEKIQRAPIEMI